MIKGTSPLARNWISSLVIIFYLCSNVGRRGSQPLRMPCGPPLNLHTGTCIYYIAVLHCILPHIILLHILCGCAVLCIATITNHIYRFLAQHKLVFKSQMGKNVEGDMIRFQVSVHCTLAQGNSYKCTSPF